MFIWVMYKMTQELIKFARKILESYFEEEEPEVSEEIKERYSEEKASFVTLTKNGDLRGCIGSLEAVNGRSLWEDIQKNVLNAAFQDPRFSPLKEKELDEIKIEISILNKPREIGFNSSEELLEKLNNNEGVILTDKNSGRTSTFLPQVWEQIPDKKLFLNHLCAKAGLNPDYWKYPEKIKIEVYEVDKIKEE
jgi:AmmeMemoRadiSam system protein A